MAVEYFNSHTLTSTKTGGTTIALAISSAVPAGRTLLASVVFDNAGTASKPVVSSIARAAGETNSWVFIGAARSTSTSIGAFASGELWAIQTSVTWPVASYTVTLDTSVAMKATRATEFKGATATLRSTSGSAYSTTTTAASASTTGTTPAVGDLVVGLTFQSNVATFGATDSDTVGGPWVSDSVAQLVGTTGGSGATNNQGRFHYKILTAASHMTLNVSTALQAGNGSIVGVLVAMPDPAITQAAYRFYADGTESGSTALAAQDTSYAADLGTADVNLGLRVRAQSTNIAPLLATDDFQLQWEKNASGTWTNVETSGLVDNYSSANADSDNSLSADNMLGYAQAFLGDGRRLSRAGFFLRRNGTPDGNLTAGLWSSPSLEFGQPTGTALTTSTTVVAASSIATANTWYYFDFDQSVTLTNGTPYCIGLISTASVNSPNDISMLSDATAPTHAGGSSTMSTGGFWNGTGGNDYIFEVYGNTVVATTAVSYDSANLTDGAVTTNRLTGGTGSFAAGKVSETGTVRDLGWTGNNFTELLYSFTLKRADFADGDTLRLRVLRNGATTGLTYTQVPTLTVSKISPIANLTDTFDTSVDSAKWGGNSVGVTWDSSGAAKIPCNSAYSEYLATLFFQWSLTNSSVFAKVTTPPLGNGGRETFFEWVDTVASQNVLQIYVSGTNLVARRQLGGTTNGILATPLVYNPATHAWLRIREVSGTAYFDYSPDGVTWTNFWSIATGFDVSSGRIQITSGYWGTETVSNVLVDNVNVAPAVAQSATGSAPVSLASASKAAWAATGSAPLSIGSASTATRIWPVTGTAPLTLTSVSSASWCARGSAPLSLLSSDGLGLNASAALSLVSASTSSLVVPVSSTTGSASLTLGSASAASILASGSAPLTLASSEVTGLRGSASVSLSSGSAASSIGLTFGSGPLTLASGGYAGSVTSESPISLFSASYSVSLFSAFGSAPLSIGSDGAALPVVFATGIAPLLLDSNSSSAREGTRFSANPLSLYSSGFSSYIAYANSGAPLSITSGSGYGLSGNAPLEIASGVSSYQIVWLTGSAPLLVSSVSVAYKFLDPSGAVAFVDSPFLTMSVVSPEGQQLVFDPVVIHVPVQVDPVTKIFVDEDPLLWDVSIDPALIFHVESTDE